MQKPASLRDHLTARLPDLARDPERLKIWVDQGTINSTQTASLGFSYSYTLNFLLTDWDHHPSIIMVLIVEWLRRHQPDLIASSSAPGFTFEVDIIDKAVVDIQLSIPLTEVVAVTRREDGGFDMQHVEEPETMFPDDLPIVPSAPVLTELWLGDERVLPGPA